MQNIMILGYSLYDIMFFFTIYAFLGWCVEVIYAAVNTGGFINRGFLNGPVCPVYGFGLMIVIMILSPLKDNLLLLFAGSLILTTLLEYITGLVLEKAFHHKWWDYTSYPFNIRGYICLKFSLIWGTACVFVLELVHPLITDAVSFMPSLLGKILLVIIVILFIADFATTVTVVLQLNIRLKQIDEIAAKLKQRSDALGQNISKETLELKEKYEKLSKQRNILNTRILKAFPDIKSNKYYESLEVLKKNMKLKNIIKK